MASVRGEREGSMTPDSQELSDGDRTQPEPQLPYRIPSYAELEFAYINKYDSVGVHEEIMKDTVLIEKYKAAIKHHQSFIQGKVVMDIGCGTGILSLLCAQAGARRVYAVEASAIAAEAEKVVIANNLADKVTVLHKRLEDIAIDEQVDVIISNWMGNMLLHESMLGSVIIARDRWLKDGGLILPSSSRLHMTPITHTDRFGESVDFWRDVHGFDMSAIAPLIRPDAYKDPCVETVSRENVVSDIHLVKHFNIYTVRMHEIVSVNTRYRFQAKRPAPVQGFAFWFDVEFSGGAKYTKNSTRSLPDMSSDQSPAGVSQSRKISKIKESLTLSTAPVEYPTHWKQTVVYLDDPVELCKASVIEGSLTLSQGAENPRAMNIHLTYTVDARGTSRVKRLLMW